MEEISFYRENVFSERSLDRLLKVGLIHNSDKTGNRQDMLSIAKARRN